MPQHRVDLFLVERCFVGHGFPPHARIPFFVFFVKLLTSLSSQPSSAGCQVEANPPPSTLAFHRPPTPFCQFIWNMWNKACKHWSKRTFSKWNMTPMFQIKKVLQRPVIIGLFHMFHLNLPNRGRRRLSDAR